MLIAQSWPTLCNPVAYETPLSMGLPRQESWSGLPFPSPGDLPTQGSNVGPLHCRQILYHLSYEGSPVTASILDKNISYIVELFLRYNGWNLMPE